MNTPNILTSIRILLVPVFILLFYLKIPHATVYALVVFIVASLTDLVDGMVARKYNMVTDFGKFMDPIADKLLVLAGIIMLMSVGKVHAVIAFVLIAREMIMSGFRLVAAAKGQVMAAGILGKIKTVTQFIAICILLVVELLPKMFYYLGYALLYIGVVFSVWSCVDYILRNRGALDLKNL
ncbi:MAG: CDP-diacylglycerol--glycerol-3-phosphate 3-phosphatidyltransferase [Eubacteriales bacterium]